MAMLKRDVYLLAGFKRVWRWDQARKECLKATNCAICGLEFPKIVKKGSIKKKLDKETQEKLPQADHIDPVVPLEGLKIVNGHIDFNQLYERQFTNKLQAICTKDHKAKSKIENAERRRLREAAIREAAK